MTCSAGASGVKLTCLEVANVSDGTPEIVEKLEMTDGFPT